MPQFCNRESSSQAHMRMREIFMSATRARARMARDIETYKERDRVSERERRRERERVIVFLTYEMERETVPIVRGVLTYRYCTKSCVPGFG